MALKTCELHETSDGEKAIIVYESYSRSCSVANCPMCDLKKELDQIKNADRPEYNAQAMGCGLEDRDITDRYQAMEYGWDQAMERIYDEVILR